MRKNLLTFLDDWEARGESPAIAYRRGLRTLGWSYRTLREASLHLASELQSRGIGKGERVLILAQNSPQWVAAFFACLLRGAIVVPLDIEGSRQFGERVQSQVEARLLLHDETHPEGISAKLPAIRLDRIEVNRSDQRAQLLVSPLRVESDPSDIAEIIYTSGTTAEPRGVCITHQNILANLEPIERHMRPYLRWERLVHPIRFLNLLPLSHVFGQLMGIFVPQLLGGETHFLNSLNPAEIIECVRKRRISTIVTVPRILDSLKTKLERDVAASRYDEFRSLMLRAEGFGPGLRWWKFKEIHRRFGLKFWAFISGGAALSPQTETFWRRLGFVVVQGYGMTETASLITVNHPFHVGHGSIGKTLPGQEVKLDDAGEILVRGDNVSPGYWKNGLQPMVDEHGWLRTGDLADVDDDGNLFFKGRSKDVIVTAAGMNVYADDLEDALRRQPEVTDCAVIGVEGALGPEPLAVMILNDDNAKPEEVVRRANQSLNQYQQIRRWEVWPDADFPRTATKKIRKPLVAERVRDLARLESNLTASTGVTARAGDRYSAFIIQQIIRISGTVPDTVAPEANLTTDLKLDSLGRVELLSAIEDQYQLDLDEASFTEATTLGEVEALVQASRRSRADSTALPVNVSEADAAVVPSSSAHSGSTSIQSVVNDRQSVVNDRGPASQVERAVLFSSRDAESVRPYPTWGRARLVRMLRMSVLYVLVLPLTWLMAQPRVVGRNRLRGLRGPLLVISNHVSMVDQALILLALPWRIRNRVAIAMEGERLRGWRYASPNASLFGKLIGWAKYLLVVCVFNVFPLPQRSGFRRSFAYAGELVDEGYSVLVFPEGRRTETGEMSCFRDGIGLLAEGLQLPVLPMKLEGLWELKKRKKHVARRGEIRIAIGPAIDPKAVGGPAELTRLLEAAVRSLEC